MTKTLVGFALALGISGPALAEPYQVTDAATVRGICRGYSESRISDLACALAPLLEAKADAIGWCYGKKGEYGYQMSWHKCRANSCRLTKSCD